MAVLLAIAAGCQQKMARQPSYRPLERSDFFDDGRASRPPVPGTVARWPLRQGDLAAWEAGKAGDQPGPPQGQPPVPGGVPPEARAEVPAALVGMAGSWDVLGGLATATGQGQAQEYATVFPMPVTERVLRRGQERYTIFCAVCHDPAGTGNGKIVERGYLKPPNYHTDYSRGYERRGIRLLLRDAPVGYYFEVVSQGFGAMPDYATQIPPADRWAIISYVRALQFSWQAPLTELPAQDQDRVRQAGEARK